MGVYFASLAMACMKRFAMLAEELYFVSDNLTYDTFKSDAVVIFSRVV